MGQPPPPIDRSPFGQTVAKLLAEHGLADRVRLHSRHGANVAVIGNRIIVGRMVVTEPAEFQCWTAAHEVAHLVLKHRPSRYGVTLLALALGCWVAAATIKLAADLATLVTVLIVVGMSATIAGIIIGRRSTAAREREADQLAATWGYPVTDQIADHLATTEGHPHRRSRLRSWTRSHDYPHDRITDPK